MNKMRLHHFAYAINQNSLEIVLELFEKFGCTLSYRDGEARWCMLEQKPINVDIQIIEVKGESAPIENKLNVHIAFLSNDPRGDIKKISEWCLNKKIIFRKGCWSDKELWFDLPEIFNNFVVEIMHTSVIE